MSDTQRYLNLLQKTQQLQAANPSLDDSSALNYINTTSVNTTTSVAASSVRDYLYSIGKWSAIIALANAARLGTKTSEGAYAAQALYDAANSGTVFDLTKTQTASQVVTDLTAIMSEGAINQTDMNSILALGQQNELMYQTIGWTTPPTLNDLIAARNI